jgi:MFS family permease
MTLSPKGNSPDELNGQLPTHFLDDTFSAADSSKSEEVNDLITDAESGNIFKNRDFMLLWVAQALTQTATQTLNLVLVAYVSKLSNESALMTSIAAICFLFPGVIFSAVAGVFVDRVKKRIMLIWTNLTRAVIVPCMALMTLVAEARLTELALLITFFLTLLFSSISQFFSPAEAAAIPMLVKRNQLARANSLFQVTLFGSLFLGIAILGPLLPKLIGEENIFIAVGFLFIACTGLVWYLPKHEVLEKTNTSLVQSIKGVTKDLIDAWGYIRADRQIWMGIVYGSLVQATLFFMIGLGLPYVESKKGLNQTSDILVFILAPLAIGLGISVVLITKIVKPQNRNRLMMWSNVVIGICVLLVGLLQPVGQFIVNMFSPGSSVGGAPLMLAMVSFALPFGFAIGILNVSALTIMQERSSLDMLGRVFAAYFTFANLVSIVPLMFGGVLGDVLGFFPVFAIFALLIIATSYYAHHDMQKQPEKYLN